VEQQYKKIKEAFKRIKTTSIESKGTFYSKDNKQTSKMLEVVLEEKRREIIKEQIKSGRIEDINSK